jgi:alanyl-tRNA synthetase
VFAEVVPLHAASQIVALRKVFGEKYPDPVRVISIGKDVGALLSDPSNPSWAELSVEFCGGTHLSNTAQAEDLVIVEESGIAKGVRRIVGLTRGQAVLARQRAADILSRLAHMESLQGGSELLALYKTVKLEVMLLARRYAMLL